jgi:CBS domain-containing protein
MKTIPTTTPTLSDSLSSALQQPVSEIMETAVVCAQPTMSLRAVMQLMVGKGINGLPVVDPNDRPIGIVSQTDLIRDRYAHASQQDTSLQALENEATVEDVMTPLIFSLPETATIAQAAALMVYERIHRVPVISAQNRVVGIVSPLDILRRIAALAGFKNPGLPRP